MDQVVYTDECKLTLDSNDSSSTWVKNITNRRRKKSFRFGLVIAWGCISRSGLVLLQKLEGTLSTAKFCGFLKDDILPVLKTKYNPLYIMLAKLQCHSLRQTAYRFWIGRHVVQICLKSRTFGVFWKKINTNGNHFQRNKNYGEKLKRLIEIWTFNTQSFTRTCTEGNMKTCVTFCTNMVPL